MVMLPWFMLDIHVYLLVRPIYSSFQNILIRLINGLATLKFCPKVAPSQ